MQPCWRQAASLHLSLFAEGGRKAWPGIQICQSLDEQEPTPVLAGRWEGVVDGTSLGKSSPKFVFCHEFALHGPQFPYL